MITLDLSNYHYFVTHNESVTRINNFFHIRKHIEPREISSAVGCPLADSFAILFILYARNSTDVFYNIYHIRHEYPVATVSIEEGIPTTGFMCGECESEVPIKQLFYTLVFWIKEDIRFILQE